MTLIRARVLLLAGCALLAACSPAKQPPELVAAPQFNTLSRDEFNRRAAERFLPLFWREDANGDAALQPDELAVLWGYPEDVAAVWRDAAGAFTPRFAAAYATLGKSAAAPTPETLSRRQQLVIEELSQSAPSLVRTDITSDSAAGQAMVSHLMRAATLIEDLYARQTGVDGLEAKIPSDDLASRALFHRNQSPFCAAPKTENDPECSALAPKPARRVGLYPADMQDTNGFCQRMEKAPNAAALMDPFNIVVAGPKPGSWATVAITDAWKEDMNAVAAELEAAADGFGKDEPALTAYLRAAAESFRSNDWEPANRAWKAMNAHNSRWYVRVAPDEVYFDPCAWKAAFALQLARINPDSIQWQQKLEPLKVEMEHALAALAGAPYKARAVQFALPDFIDVVLNAGDQRKPSGATIGQSLPNWGPVARSGGRTVSMTNLYMDPDSRARRATQDAAMFCAATDSQYRPTGSETILNSVLHEAAHNLGPSHDYAVNGKTGPVAFGGPLASTLEELKAQNSALYLTSFLAARSIFTADDQHRILRDGVIWAFGHISRGMYAADGTPRNYSQLAAIQIGSFLDSGGLTWRADELAANGRDHGCLAIDFVKLPAAVEALEKTVLGIKARADRGGAEKLKARYVDANDGFAEIKATIATRYQRTPKATFVYSIAMPD
jgi:hypothetical protein